MSSNKRVLKTIQGLSHDDEKFKSSKTTTTGKIKILP